MTHDASSAPKPPAVLLDFDDTVLATSSSRRRLFFDHFHSFGIGAEAVERLERHWGKPLPVLLRAALPEGMHDEFVASYLGAMRSVPPVLCRGADAFLRAARRRGLPVMLISSSSSRLIRADLEALGLLELITEIYGAEDVPVFKPDPGVLEPARRRLRELGMPRFSDVLYLGDGLSDLAAVDGDCEFAAVLTGDTTAEQFLAAGVRSDHIFPSLGDAVGLL